MPIDMDMDTAGLVFAVEQPKLKLKSVVALDAQRHGSGREGAESGTIGGYARLSYSGTGYDECEQSAVGPYSNIHPYIHTYPP